MIILGASFDTPAENRAFAAAQEFPFRLLSDADREVASAYGVAREPSDKFSDYPRRYSYLIDPVGLIHQAYDVTDVANHPEQVIADIEQAASGR